VINKVDLAPAMEVDPHELANDARKVNPKAKIILTDARHERGINELMRAIGF
jgi:Ni2+-binding GTPase involved in maturation of urease and hydrogenase